jgi:hypothetical protein
MPEPESLAMFLGLHQNGAPISDEDAVGGTPTAAVETTALPKKSLMIRVPEGKSKLPFHSIGCLIII